MAELGHEIDERERTLEPERHALAQQSAELEIHQKEFVREEHAVVVKESCKRAHSNSFRAGEAGSPFAALASETN